MDFGRILACQNLPKIHPKCLQNRCPKNLRFFIDFCSNFDACCKSQHQKNVRPRSVLLAFHTIWCFAFGMPFRSKNLSKTLPKRRPRPSKIDAKNMSLFDIDFFRFQSRYWTLLDLQVGTKLPQSVSAEIKVAFCKAFSN